VRDLAMRRGDLIGKSRITLNRLRNTTRCLNLRRNILNDFGAASDQRNLVRFSKPPRESRAQPLAYAHYDCNSRSGFRSHWSFLRLSEVCPSALLRLLISLPLLRTAADGINNQRLSSAESVVYASKHISNQQMD
jgi:hypothetical protein